MAKITAAVLYRGAMRPDVHATIRNVSSLTNNLKSLGVIPRNYLTTWTPEHTKTAVHLFNSGLFDGYIMTPARTDREIKNIVGDVHFNINQRPYNSYRQYYQSKTALDVICTDPAYSHVIHTRVDFCIEFPKDQLDEWFCDQYKTLHVRTTEDNFVNDCIGVAPREIMQKAWDYGTVDKLVGYFKKADIAEHVLEMIMTDNGVIPGAAPLAKYLIDPDRSQGLEPTRAHTNFLPPELSYDSPATSFAGTEINEDDDDIDRVAVVGAESSAVVKDLFHFMLKREPNSGEIKHFSELLQRKGGFGDLLKIIIGSPEFSQKFSPS